MAASGERHLALIGGLRRAGRWTPARRILHVALIGGATLDFTEAEFTTREVAVSAVSLVGGVRVVVPPDVGVEARGVSLGLLSGGTSGPAPGTATAVLRVRRLGLLGGVQVERRD